MTSNGKKLQKSASGNTALDKESIVELMKTVFEEEFAKQQQPISKIIENNLEITKQEMVVVLSDERKQVSQKTLRGEPNSSTGATSNF